MLEREHSPSPAEADLNLVDAEQGAVTAAELLGAFEIARRREVRPVPLDGLDDEDGDVLAAQLRLERVEVVVGHTRETRQERAVTRSERRIARRRERTQRQAVEAVLARDDARAPRRRASQLQRGLDRLSPGGREEHAPERRRRP